MTKTHRLKTDPYRPILQHEPEANAAGASPGPALRPRAGFHFVHDDRFHQRLARVIAQSWFVAEPPLIGPDG